MNLFFLGPTATIRNGVAVVIILCFFLTSTTSFEYMLNSTEEYKDRSTGQPCMLNETKKLEMNLTTTPSTVLRDIDDIAFGPEQMRLKPEVRNLTGQLFDVAESESIYCVKVCQVLFHLQSNRLSQDLFLRERERGKLANVAI